MKKHSITFALIITMIIFVTGCNRTTNAIVDYNNEFLVEDYSKALNTFLKLSDDFGEQVEKEQMDTVAHEAYLQEQLIPQAKQLVKLVHDVKIDNEVVQDLHQLLIDAEENRLQALENEYEYIQDLEKVDIIEKADENVLESERKMDEFIKKLDQLKDEYNIEDDD